MLSKSHNIRYALSQVLTIRTGVRLSTVWIIVISFMIFGNSFFNNAMSPVTAGISFIILLSTVIGASFGVLKEADELSHKLGEPYGTLILTFSVLFIEVILISAVMLGPSENPTIGKDSIFSVMMIIMNLIIGLCILLGGLKFGEQEYNSQGTISYLAMIIVLGGIGLILPNFIEGAGGGRFSNAQAITITLIIVVLYGLFLLMQLKGYKHLYVQPKPGDMEIPFKERFSNSNSHINAKSTKVNNKSELWIRFFILVLMLLPIILLSHNMAIVIDYGLEAAKLPPFLGGVVIAIIVFTPESMTAVKAALNNEFQRAVNLCQGAFMSTVGLTVPCILTVGLITGKTVLFGLTSTETILFVITLLLSVMTFLGKRTTPSVGLMHLAIFAVFIMLIFNP
ncbi:calcium:proton antiporter [Flavobacterium sp. xlx-214]|nr:calcium:proton antiporter [Flavobacterium sp. xlx-221]QMI82943.1 calcium:proton antiporter [Flavobacterium sp. xlx-214]